MGQVERNIRDDGVPGWFGTPRHSASGTRPLRFGAGLALLLLVAFFVFPYLPMVDLPQHAAQISVWLHLGDKSFPGVENFDVNLRTPYLTGYVLARVLAGWIGVVAALKLVMWLCVVGHWAAFAALVRRLGHPAWVGLFGIPLAFGYAFYFGFVSFLAAIPLALLSLSVAVWHREAPSWKSGCALAIALSSTLLSHGFACGVALAMVGSLLLRGEGRFVARMAPLVAPVLLAWFWLAPGSSVQRIGSTIWSPRIVDLLQLPAMLLAASATDHAASLFGVLILVLLGMALGSPSRKPERWLPLFGVLLGFCLFPASMGGFGPLHPRFAAFLAPALLVAFEPRRRPLPQLWPALALTVCGAWCALFVWRMSRFAAESQPVQGFVQKMPKGLVVRPIVFERESSAFPGLPVHLHLSAYYLAEKGGIQGYSFAMYPTSVIRYVPGFIPGMGGGAEWHPDRFSADRELDKYDCFLVHSHKDRSLQLFGDRLKEVALDFHQGDWWAYRVRPTAQHAWPQASRVRI